MSAAMRAVIVSPADADAIVVVMGPAAHTPCATHHEHFILVHLGTRGQEQCDRRNDRATVKQPFQNFGAIEKDGHSRLYY